MTFARLVVVVVFLFPLRDGFSQPWRRVFPEARLDGPSLAHVLATRRSVRELATRELSEVEIGELLWAAQGVIDGHRTAPSAGALYPLTVWVADARGVWRYVPAEHALERASTVDVRGNLGVAAYDQRHVRIAPAVLVITADVAITARKYGPRAERFAVLEAGHVAQNVLLQATALGLAAVPVGAFDDASVRRALDAAPQVTPLYLIPIGARP